MLYTTEQTIKQINTNNMTGIDNLVDQVVDRHRKLASSRHLTAKNNKCKQKGAVGAMIDAHPVATVLIFYIGFLSLLLTIAGILAATCGHSCCCCC